jgi:hypothetical protein
VIYRSLFATIHNLGKDSNMFDCLPWKGSIIFIQGLDIPVVHLPVGLHSLVVLLLLLLSRAYSSSFEIVVSLVLM